MKKIAIPVVLILLLGGGAWFYFRTQKPQDPNVVRVSGNIEITDAALSFRIPGRIVQRFVSEGNTVKKEQIAATLDDQNLQQEVDLRKAELHETEAALQELLAGSLPEEVGQSEAALARFQSEEERARLDFEREQKLYEQQITPKRDLDAAKSVYDSAQARVTEAKKSLKLVQKGPRIEKIEQAKAQVQRAEKALLLAETNLQYATLVAPMDGVVLTQSVEAGEYVSAGTPVVTVGKMDEVWLRAFIDETDLGRIHLGQAVRVKTDTYPDRVYEGKVSFISQESEFTPKTVQTDKERVKLVYRIKIDVPNPKMELKPGMPADGEIVLAGAI